MLFRTKIFLIHVAAVWSFIIQRTSQSEGTNAALLSAFPGNIAAPARSTSDTIPLEQVFPNQSQYSSNMSGSTPSAACDGLKYGRDVKSSSCISALEIIPDLERPVSFGPRTQGSFMLGLYISVLRLYILSDRRSSL